MKLLPEIVQTGRVVECLTVKDVHLLEVGEYAAIQLPNDQPLSCLAVIRKGVESNEFVSCYPAINDGDAIMGVAWLQGIAVGSIS